MWTDLLSHFFRRFVVFGAPNAKTSECKLEAAKNDKQGKADVKNDEFSLSGVDESVFPDHRFDLSPTIAFDNYVIIVFQ